jgi:hypothetical protein
MQNKYEIYPLIRIENGNGEEPAYSNIKMWKFILFILHFSAPASEEMYKVRGWERECNSRHFSFDAIKIISQKRAIKCNFYQMHVMN